MKFLTILVALATLAVVPVFADGTYEVKYVSNLSVGDAVINMTNTGQTWGQYVSADPLVQNGDICVNVYVFTPDEQLQECCSCFLTPNALASYSAIADLTANTLTGVKINSAVIKLVSSVACVPDTNPSSGTYGQCVPSTSPTSCNAATVGQIDRYNFGHLLGQPLAGGLAAWGTSVHANTSTSPVTYQVTETPFDNSNLSAKELNRLTTLCSFIQQNGSTSGICNACRLGGL